MKGKLPAGQLQHRLLRQRRQIAGNPRRVHIVGTQDDRRPLAFRRNSGRKKSPVHRTQTAGGNGTAPRVNAQQQVLKFRDPLESI